MRVQAGTLPWGDLLLEGLLTLPDDAPAPLPAVAVCHPHPMDGGDMDNEVVAAFMGWHLVTTARPDGRVS